MRVHDLLRGKGFSVITVRPDTPIGEAVRQLHKYNLGSVVVSRDGKHVDGILTERDVVRRLAEDADFLDSPAADIMTSEVLTCRAGDSVQSLMTTMTEQRLRHLPVVDDQDALIGIISIGDVVKSHVTQLQFERDQLEGYLSR